MKVCPMCTMPQLEKGLSACQFCGYEEKPIEKLSKKELYDLMASYEYERTEDGCRIKVVKNIRDIALRGAITLPHFVTEIDAEAFSHCKFLAAVELPRTLRSIGDGAFSHCRDLFDVYIPESVTSVGSGIFAECYSMHTVRCEAPEKPEGWSDAWLDGCSATVEWSSTEVE